MEIRTRGGGFKEFEGDPGVDVLVRVGSALMELDSEFAGLFIETGGVDQGGVELGPVHEKTPVRGIVNSYRG